MRFITLLFSPFLFLYFFVIQPFLKYLLRSDYERFEKQNKDRLETIYSYRRENEALLKRIEQLEKEKRLLSLLADEYNNIPLAISKTKNDEVVFIREHVSGHSTTLTIHSLDNEFVKNDCEITYSTFCDNRIHIDDFQASTMRRGYGRTLLNYFFLKIKTEKDKNLQIKISGDLSPEDKENFDWLISFYESMGLTCVLFDNPNGGMLGKVYIIV